MQDVEREIQVMYHLAGDPNIVALHAVYEDRRAIHIVRCDDAVFVPTYYIYFTLSLLFVSCTISGVLLQQSHGFISLYNTTTIMSSIPTILPLQPTPSSGYGVVHRW